MIDAEKIASMVRHWLNTPPNGYFGQGYGSDTKSLLLKELSANTADQLLAQLRQHIPLLNQLNDEQLAIHEESNGFDTKSIYLSIGKIHILLNDNNNNDSNQDYYDIRAQ